MQSVPGIYTSIDICIHCKYRFCILRRLFLAVGGEIIGLLFPFMFVLKSLCLRGIIKVISFSELEMDKGLQVEERPLNVAL